VELISKTTTDSSTDGSFSPVENRQRTADGKTILEPQPDNTPNDPLNWPLWKRTTALFVLGFYCMVGGGMAPLLAAGFNDVAQTYDVAVEKVALTTGFYMLGLGVGGVGMVPTAIKYGKRPVYLITCIMMIGTSIWCATSPSYPSLVAARIAQGIAVSPIEVLVRKPALETILLGSTILI
jgi:MFS family permease